MTIQDRAAKMLQEIEASIVWLNDTTPEEEKPLKMLKTAIEGLLECRDSLNQQCGVDDTPCIALTTLCDQWEANK